MTKLDILRACQSYGENQCLKKVIDKAYYEIKCHDDKNIGIKQDSSILKCSSQHYRNIYSSRLRSCKERNYYVIGLEETAESFSSLPDDIAIGIVNVQTPESNIGFWIFSEKTIVGCIITPTKK